ncbi:hypothetical protein RIF23_10980 [Lipingzhangella sp. LS1_29]|uniref:DUF7144 domain-containing protein n=1 Tax=Lipingzhangella rawalii TaxID=2055835 RepID=A0ABU2H682_9ACTN|nr:hypothetical protein [Lipingzhangella rawalii]MDS1270824.1 hypothetical protein [Lipingzhangella rawalii]
MNETRIHGWAAGAAVLLLVVGLFHLVQGWVALMQPEHFMVAGGELVVLNFTAWGTILVVWGALMALAGLAVFTAQMWARTIGVALAAISILVQLTFLFAFPLWSLAVVAINLMIVYGLTAGFAQMSGQQGPAAASAYASGRSDAREAREGKHAMPRQEDRRDQESYAMSGGAAASGAGGEAMTSTRDTATSATGQDADEGTDSMGGRPT